MIAREKRTTIATVNKLFKERGMNVTMYRGDGYYYFISPDYQINSLYQMYITNEDPLDIVQYVLDNSGDNYYAGK